MLKKRFGQIKKEIRVLKYFLKQAFKASKIYIFVVFISNIILGVLPFINIILPKLVLDELLTGRRINLMILYVSLILGVNLIFGIIVKRFQSYIKIKNQDIVKYFESNTAGLMMAIGYDNLENPDFIDLKERAMHPVYTRGVLYDISALLPRLIGLIITFAGTIAIISTFSIAVVGIIIIFIIINSLINLHFQKGEIENQKKIASTNKSFGHYINFVRDQIVGKDIRIYDMSDFFIGKIKEQDDFILNYSRSLCLAKQRNAAANNIISAVTNALVYGYIGIKTLKENLSLGSFAMYISAAAIFSKTLHSILNQLIELRTTCRYLEDYVTLNETPRQSETGNNKISEKPVEICFDNVSFKYPKSDDYVLRNINITLYEGDSLSIVGRNGAGKTTFIKLLSRLYSPTEGRILINGIDIFNYKYDEYMKLLAVIFQDFKTFEFTVRENIAMSDADENKVVNSLDKAGLDDLIKQLPYGLDTYAGKSFEETGILFSGGQLQKLAIARAVYKDAEIIILDEPTAALDPKAEAEVYEKFNELISGKTAIYISHRLSSCKFCKNIAFLENGTITEYGSHDALIKLKGSYAAMFELQKSKYQLYTVDGK